MELCNKLPTVVAFIAPSWCGPCKRLKPSLDNLMRSEGSNYHILEIIDSDPLKNQYIDLFKITGYPTVLIYFPEANKFVKFEGLKTDDVESYKSQIDHFIRSNIGKKQLNLIPTKDATYNVSKWNFVPNFKQHNIKFTTHNSNRCTSVWQVAA